MAGEAKITKKIIDETASILKAVPEDKIDDIAAKLGVDTELVSSSIKNPKSKQAKEFFTTSLKKVGESLEGMQKFVDQALGRGKEEAVELATKRDIGIGGQPPAVGEAFKTEVTAPLAAGKGKGFTSTPSTGERGGPLVPVAQPGRLGSVASKLQASEAPLSTETALVPVGPRMERPTMSAQEMAEATGKAQSGPAGRGVVQVTPESKTRIAEAGRTEAERAADFQLSMKGLPSERVVELGAKAAKAAVGGAAVGAGGLGLGLVGRMLFDKGFSGDEAAPPVVQAAGVEDVPDVKTVVNTIPETAMPAEQKQALEKQVDDFTAAVQSFERRMAAEGKEARDEKKLKEGRLEFMRALETIMHGMVSALGANAMLNRGSPFALDFSKGPQTDWASEFDRLQKSYDSQMAEIRSRYGLAMKEKQEQRAAAQAASREARAERELQLKEREIGIKEQKEKEQQAAKQAAALTKLSAADQKTYKENLSFYGDLRKAIAEKKPGPAQDAATKLGADEVTLKNLEAAMGQGLISKALNLVGLSKEPDTEQILQGLRPQKPGQAEAEAAPEVQLPSALVDPNGTEVKRPQGMTDAQWKATVDTIEATWAKQNKKINKRY